MVLNCGWWNSSESIFLWILVSSPQHTGVLHTVWPNSGKYMLVTWNYRYFTPLIQVSSANRLALFYAAAWWISNSRIFMDQDVTGEAIQLPLGWNFSSASTEISYKFKEELASSNHNERLLRNLLRQEHCNAAVWNYAHERTNFIPNGVAFIGISEKDELSPHATQNESNFTCIFQGHRF